MSGDSKMSKKTWVKITKYEDGRTLIEGECDFCKQFPCEHVTEQGYFATDTILKINTQHEFAELKSCVFTSLMATKLPAREKIATLSFLLGELEKIEGGVRLPKNVWGESEK